MLIDELVLDSWLVSGQSRHGFANLVQLPLIHLLVGYTFILLNLSSNDYGLVGPPVLGIGRGIHRVFLPGHVPLCHLVASRFHRLE
jgi:hypothetical protein